MKRSAINLYPDDDFNDPGMNFDFSPDECDLFEAVKLGDIEEVCLLINSGADVSEVDEEGDTPLHLAVKNSEADIACVLVEDGGADITLKNDKHETPVHLAASMGNLEMMKSLLVKSCAHDCHQALARKNADGNTPLHLAAGNDSLDVLQYLLKKGASVSAKNHNGATALEIAIKRGLLLAVQCLVRKDHDSLEERNAYGYTPLHQAVIYGRNDIITWFLDKAGAKLFEEASGHGATPLFLAMKMNHKATAQLLLSKGAAIKADLTVIDMASLDLNHCVTIGAEEAGQPKAYEKAINNTFDLRAACLAERPLDYPALLRAVTARLSENPEDVALQEAQVILRRMIKGMRTAYFFSKPETVPPAPTMGDETIISCKKG